MNDCIEFQGYREKKGYGRIGSGKTRRSAHREAYAVFHGLDMEALKGRVVMHTCDNPPCVNPDHLVLGTVADNNRDKAEKGRAPATYKPPFLPQCKRGHELVEGNLYYKKNGDRQCRACNLARKKGWDDD